VFVSLSDRLHAHCRCIAAHPRAKGFNLSKEVGIRSCNGVNEQRSIQKIVTALATRFWNKGACMARGSN
jgi:hypothetical protein